jgi:hypothetical protein
MSALSLEAETKALEHEIQTIQQRSDQDLLSLASKSQEHNRLLNRIAEAASKDPKDE